MAGANAAGLEQPLTQGSSGSVQADRRRVGGDRFAAGVVDGPLARQVDSAQDLGRRWVERR